MIRRIFRKIMSVFVLATSLALLFSAVGGRAEAGTLYTAILSASAESGLSLQCDAINVDTVEHHITVELIDRGGTVLERTDCPVVYPGSSEGECTGTTNLSTRPSVLKGAQQSAYALRAFCRVEVDGPPNSVRAALRIVSTVDSGFVLGSTILSSDAIPSITRRTIGNWGSLSAIKPSTLR